METGGGMFFNKIILLYVKHFKPTIKSFFYGVSWLTGFVDDYIFDGTYLLVGEEG